MGEEERCCVCLLRKKRPLCSPECLHGMCGLCSARHVWRSKKNGLVSCPLCRARIRRLVPAEEGSGSDQRRISVEFAGVTFEILLKKSETVKDCLDHFFNIPNDRLKVIRSGKVVNDLEELATTPGKYRVLGTPKFDQLKADSMLLMQLRDAGEKFWDWVVKFFAALYLFFISLFTDVRKEHNQETRRRERERERLQAQHQHYE